MVLDTWYHDTLWYWTLDIMIHYGIGHLIHDIAIFCFLMIPSSMDKQKSNDKTVKWSAKICRLENIWALQNRKHPYDIGYQCRSISVCAYRQSNKGLPCSLTECFNQQPKYHNNPKYWDREACANCVDPDQMPQMQHLIRVYTVCNSSQQFVYKSTSSNMDLFDFRTSMIKNFKCPNT